MESNERKEFFGIVLGEHFRDRRRQRRLAVIDMADRADVDVRFASVKFFFRHVDFSSSGKCCVKKSGAVDQD